MAREHFAAVSGRYDFVPPCTPSDGDMIRFEDWLRQVWLDVPLEGYADLGM